MYTDTQQWQQIRNLYYHQRLSKREIMRRYGMHCTTLQRMLKYPLPVRREKPPHTSRKRRFARPSKNKLRDAVQVIRDTVTPTSIPPAHRSVLYRLVTYLTNMGFTARQNCNHYCNDYEPHLWMHRIMQRKETLGTVAAMVGDIQGLPILVEKAVDGTLMERRKAITVLAQHRGISFRSIGRFLCKNAISVTRYWGEYEAGGVSGIFRGYHKRARLADNEEIKAAVFSLLHSPPSQYDINRTSWIVSDLRKCLKQKGFPSSKEMVSEILKSAGYKWRKAKTVLTSNDPEYREKLERIKSILSTLGENDRFCSIDEFGSFAIKIKGGKRIVAPDEYPHVPQFQKSKGWLILTAALELSQNQVTHFYSRAKNTSEMIKLLEVLLEKYKGCDNLFLSWDAASWHASKALYKKVDLVNQPEYRAATRTPYVTLVPLPSSAQFLNVIESVFSGMAKAIIHNSDYQSVEEAMAAIDRYFRERNEYFQTHPKRAGKKIWGEERVACAFSESNNCKDPKF